MKKKLFLHIGPPKTGTSTLQHFLAANRENLASSGIIYPLEEEPSHWKLCLRVGLTMWPWTVDEATTPSWKDISLVSAKNPGKHLLLSSESFSYAVLGSKKDGSEKLIRELKSLGREIHVIIYLRRQDLWAESYFIEYLKHFGKNNFDKFLADRADSLDYYKVLSFWAKIAGKNNLTARVYESQQLPDICSDFMEILGITDLTGFNKVENKNHRPSLLQMQILQGYVGAFHQKFPSPPPDFNKPFGDLDNMLGGFLHKASQWPSTHQYHLLPYEKARQVLSACELSNEKAARKFLGRKDGVLFRDSLSAYEQDDLTWPSELNAEEKMAIADLWKETCNWMREVTDPVAMDSLLDFEKEILDQPGQEKETTDNEVERYLPGMAGFEIGYEHWHRYLYATHFSKGKTVLDIACGDGYGAYLLAENASEVIGVDIEKEVIDQAQKRYPKDNLSFLKGSVSEIPVTGKAKFDLIVSFETIEHVNAAQQAAFMKEVKRLLKPGGLFLVSTPDKRIYSDLRNYRNPFHVKEFYANEFTSFLQDHFKYVEVLGQDIYTTSYIHPESREGGIQEYDMVPGQGLSPQKNTASQDEFLVGVCSEKPLSPLPSSLLFNSKNKRAVYDLSYQQLYIDTGGGYNESNSLFASDTERKQTITFDLTGFASIKSLRFDPAACPVYINLNGIWIETNNGDKIKLDFSSNAVHQENSFLLFDTHDPQILPEIPGDVSVKSISIDLEILAMGNLAVYPYLKSLVDQKIIATSKTNESLTSQLKLSNHKLRSLKKNLEQSEDLLSLQEKLTLLASSYLNEKKEAVDILTARLSDTQALVLLKEEQLSQLQVKLDKAQDTLRSLRDTSAQKDTELTQKEERIQLLLEQVNTSLQTIESLQTSISGKEEMISRQHVKLVNRNKKLKGLRQTKEDLELAKHDLEVLYAKAEEEISILLRQVATAEVERDDARKKLKDVERENEARGKYIEHLNDRVGSLENVIHDKDAHVRNLQEVQKAQDRYIGELKHSISFRLGWMITAPFRWVYEGLNVAFWSRFLGIIIRNPTGFLRNINKEKISILWRAIKNEPPSLILSNFTKLLRGSGSKSELQVQKKEKYQAPLTSEQPKEQGYTNTLTEKRVNKLTNEKKINHYIDQLEELDFHVSIRGWLFEELNKIESLSLSISQGEKKVKKMLFYGIDRPDVYHHYGRKTALCSGFSDSIEKPFTGKVHLNLVATFADGTQSIVDLGETTFRKPFLESFSGDIVANRKEFFDRKKKRKKRKNEIALYTNSKGNYFFNEIKALVSKGLQDLGYETLLLDETDGFDNDALLHIVIAPHEFFEIGAGTKYIQKSSDRLLLLNTEQPSSSWFRKGTAYFRQAIEVWDMNYYSWQRIHESIQHAKFLPLGFANGFDLLSEVRKLPENYCTCFLDEKIRNRSYLKSNFEDRPIDILFVGHASPRRQRFFAKNAAFFAQYNCYFHLTDLSLGPVKGNKNNMNTRTAIGLAQRSKIILNIHHGTHEYFEWHRMVMHGIWQRGLVISDICGDGPPFLPGKHFVQAPLDELPDKIAYFLNTASGRNDANKIIKSAFNVLTSKCDIKVALKRLTAPLLNPDRQEVVSPETSISKSS